VKAFAAIIVLLLLSLGAYKAGTQKPTSARRMPSLWERLRSSWSFRFALKAVSVVSSILVFGLAMAEYWGPFWPTGPTIHPNGLDLIRPLSVPFDIENKSVLFPVHILVISCTLLSEFTPSPGTQIGPMTLGYYVDIFIPPNKKTPYPCDVDLSIYRPTPFSMCFTISYEPSWLAFWKKQDVYATDTFFWQNGHWTEGVITRRTAGGAYEAADIGCSPLPPPPPWRSIPKKSRGGSG
jgi:hypothetical protein